MYLQREMHIAVGFLEAAEEFGGGSGGSTEGFLKPLQSQVAGRGAEQLLPLAPVHSTALELWAARRKHI